MIAALALAALTLAPLAWLWLYEKPRALDGDQFFDTITDWRNDLGCPDYIRTNVVEMAEAAMAVRGVAS